jgi:acyl-CoA synthetase (AMP-forming)/AMP-acid ligase II
MPLRKCTVTAASTGGRSTAALDGVAARLLSAGLAHDKVALYLYNTPEYLETAFAVMKAALVPVTRTIAKHDELHYLWDNADVLRSCSTAVHRRRGRGARVSEGEAVAARDAAASHAAVGAATKAAAAAVA